MPTVYERKTQRFFYEVVEPLQIYAGQLYEGGHAVEALYLASHVVKVAIRRGVMRELDSFLDRHSHRINTIGIAIEAARGAAAMGHLDLASLPAVTAMMGLAPYFGLEPPSYEDIYDSNRFVTFSNKIVTESRKRSNFVPNRIAAGMLASAARIAALDGLPLIQELVLGELDAKSRELNPVDKGPRMEIHAVELGRAARFAREFGDTGSAIAFGLLGGGSATAADQFATLSGIDSEYIPISQQYRRMGQPGTAGLLFETAIEGASPDSIERMVQGAGHVVSDRTTSRRQQYVAQETTGWTGRSAPTAGLKRDPKSTVPAAQTNPEKTVATVSAPAASSEKQSGPSEPRHVNAWFEDGDEQLEIDRSYYLAINIGKLRPGSLATEPIVEPNFSAGAPLELLVVIGGHGFSIKRHQQTLWLPPEGDSEIVRFQVTPRTESPFLRISIYMAIDLTLVEEFEIPLSRVTRSRAA
ncbi:hypothetical protein [Reyranella sp.]|uniref:hypothetical protein n=1 Tax=Reyranella sp. TaxID=1929291 RepID=UPI003BAA5311